MSVRFTLVTRFVRNVRSRFPSSWRKRRARRAKPPAKREPKTASAASSTKTWTIRAMSFGWYSRSASWMTVMAASARARPGWIAAPLPPFRPWRRKSQSIFPFRPRPRSATAIGSPDEARGAWGDAGEDVGAPVLRGVVDDDHLDPLQVGARLQHLQPRERRRYEVLLVVDGDEDGEGGHAEGCFYHARPAGRGAPSRACRDGCPGRQRRAATAAMRRIDSSSVKVSASPSSSRARRVDGT